MSECIGIAPFEVVKVRMQASNRVAAYSSVSHCAQEILKSEGVVGFTRGLESALWRNGSWNGTYFSLIWLSRQGGGDGGGGVLSSVKNDKLRNFMSGFIGGTFATVANNPFDVVASRMRNVVPGEVSPLRFSWQALYYISRKEGLTALYRGFWPKVLRLGPGGGIMILSFEVAKDILIGV
jgi:solute carrier family 25 2-oxodicarboxylate transporter 21